MKASPLTLLATFYRRGGLTILTPADGPPILRTVIQPDGDLVTFTTPAVTEPLLDQHIAALQTQMKALHTARIRVATALGTTLAGGALLTSGLTTEGDTGTWLAWIGGGTCALPAGGGLYAAWRVVRWLKSRAAFGPPRGA